MNKKIAIIGKGTAGSITAAHFTVYTSYDIDWYFDENIKVQAVGEGTTVQLLRLLYTFNEFNYDKLYKELQGTFKHGIRKQNWGEGKEYTHYFQPPFISMHFNALKLQDYIAKTLENNSRVKFINTNVKSHNDIDADYIIDCGGKPETYENFNQSEIIPVNSVYVTQCWWDQATFQYTGTIARKYGWVFCIPLQNRCSVGYLYNNKFNSLDDIKEDVKAVFSEYKLTPSDTTNSFSFHNYYKKQNFTDRVFYNGNSSFFLEPMEATSLATIEIINRMSWDIMFNNMSVPIANNTYLSKLQDIEAMIGYHYYHGSIFNTKFWKEAKEKGKKAIIYLKNSVEFKEMLEHVDTANFQGGVKDYATWGVYSWYQNLKGFNCPTSLFK